MFKAQFGEQTFELDKITIGDWRVLKREFGVTPDDMIAGDGDEGRLRIEEPEVLAGLLVCCLRHERPDASVSELVAEVDSLDIGDLEFPQEEAEVEPDPQTAADDAATESKPKGKAKGRSSGTRQKTSGSQR